MTNECSPDAVYAVVRVSGEVMDFDAVTRAVGLQPSEIRRAGDVRATGKPVPRNVWMLEAPLPKKETLDSHLKWLRSALLPACGFLRSRIAREDVSIYCGVSVEGDRSTFVLSAEALKLFVELGVSLDLSLVFTGYSELGVSPLRVNASEPFLQPDQDEKRTQADAALRIQLASEEDLARAAACLGIGTLETGSLSENLAEGNDAKALVIRAPIDPTPELDVYVEWIAGFVSRNADAIRAMIPARISVLSTLATESDQATTSIGARPLQTLVEMEIPVQFELRLV